MDGVLGVNVEILEPLKWVTEIASFTNLNLTFSLSGSARLLLCFDSNCAACV